MQSDVELLSIQAMEVYAVRNKLMPQEVSKLFHEHQVFEKIILQHEYLHQISFEEVMEFVERIIMETADELILFHGTVSDFDTIALEKSHNRRDFGMGFYTTLLEQQAKEWGYRLSLRERKDRYYIYRYIFREGTSMKVKRFDSLNKEWLEFVKKNRSEGGLQHDNDIVIGPVADDNTMETVQLYSADILTADEAIERLKYNKVNNQVSFHTRRALSCLKLVGREVYE